MRALVDLGPLDTYEADLISEYYRWYTCFAWKRPLDIGLKLGPVTFTLYRMGYQKPWTFEIHALARHLLFASRDWKQDV